MRTVYLRHILEAGFCGRNVDSYPGRGRGHTHVALDRLILNGKLETYALEDRVVQAGNAYDIPYEEREYFGKCLAALNAKSSAFTGGGLVAEEHDSTFDGCPEETVIRHITIRSGDIYVEPFYGFYAPTHFTPFFALCSAFLSGQSDSVRIKTVSLFGDMANDETYPIRPAILRRLLTEALDHSNTKPGWPCMSCPKKDCNFNEEFHAMVHEWLKAKQRLEESERKLKDHLTMHGPTQSGAHLIHMKAHRRRFFNDAQFGALYAKLVELDPKGYMRFFTPDAAEIFKAIEKGDLPQELKNFFKQSQYYTIEGSLSP